MNTRMHDRRAGREALTAVGYWPAERTFRRADVSSVRRLAADFGSGTGIGSMRLADFVLAVSEAASCVVAGGPGCPARLRLWTTGPRVLCEVRGGAPRQCAGGSGYGEAEEMRRWLLGQLCDYSSVSSGPDGVMVLLSISVI